MRSAPPTVEDLERWRLFGADCRIVERCENAVIYELCTCTGETVERHESSDPELIEYLVSTRAGEGDDHRTDEPRADSSRGSMR
ncbi:MAG: hypothetical protein ACRDL8_16530 [Solirubrobacteraceae bacterium]